MPTRLPFLALLALVSAFALSAAAQAPTSFAAHTASASGTPSLDVYAGHYTTDGGSAEVRAEAGHLTVVAYGAPVAARFALLAPGAADRDARAADLLDAWVVGDLAPLAEAVAPQRRAASVTSFEAYRSALVRGYGEPVAASVVGTFEQIDGRSATLAQVLFEHGTEWLSFVWNDDGEVLTIARGLSPVVLGPVRPAGRDTFEGNGATLTFSREADGRVSGLSVGARLVAVR